MQYLCNPSGSLNPKKLKNKLLWQPLASNIVAEASPEAVTVYATKPNQFLAAKVRDHLSYLGWKVEFSSKDGVTKYRYITPDGSGRVYYSLQKLCIDLRSPVPEQKDESISAVSHAGNGSGDGDVCVVEEKEESQFVVSGGGGNEDGNLCVAQEKEESNFVASRGGNEDGDLCVVAGEYCPQAVVDWFKYEGRSMEGGVRARHMIMKAKKHLSYMGWVFWNVNKNGRRYLRYTSPKGSNYYCLRRACKAYIDDYGRGGGGAARGEGGLVESVVNSNNTENLASSFVAPAIKSPDISHSLSQKRKRMEVSFSSNDVESETELSTKKAGRSNVNVDERDGVKRRTGKNLLELIRLRDASEKRSSNQRSSRVLRSSKRVREGVDGNSSARSSGIVCWLIENNVVLQGAKVRYFTNGNQFAVAEGLITRSGIRCICCQKLFNLDRFQVHAEGRKRRRKPATCMFLDDGRSIFDCVEQLRKRLEKKEDNDDDNVMKDQIENDDVCSVCRYGGELVLCDGCPSAFHKNCLGLDSFEELPEEDWFCKSCCCQICGRNGGEDNKQCYEFISCSQCELKYHTKCLKRQNRLKNYHPESNWFCCYGCERVSIRLRMLVGRPIPVNDSDLNWTLLKYSDELDVEELTETYSKLRVAAEVMHECFEPAKDPRTGRDLVDDVIFSKGSVLNRLNFKNFHTIILEKDGEVISVATLRVHGQRVAELPLVATRFQHRRYGMCRMMMNELEKQLAILGVERLILPAALSVLDTWTNWFEFSKMMESEKLQFLNHSFLDFQDTIMCQKLLLKTPWTSPQPKFLCRRSTDSCRGSDESSPQSEVLQDQDHSRFFGRENKQLIRLNY